MLVPPSDDHTTVKGQAESCTFVQKVLIIAGVAAAFLFVYEAGPVVAVVFAATLLGVALRGLGNAAAQFSGLSPAMALSACLAVILACLAAGGWVVGSEVAQQTDRLLEASEGGFAQVRASLREYYWGVQIVSWWDNLSWQPSAQFVSHLSGAINVGTQIVSTAAITLAMGLFIAFNPRLYRNGVLALVPPHRQPRFGEVLDTMACVLQRWVGNRVLDMAGVGLITGVGLYFLGSPAPMALGLLTFLLQFIPFFGAILAAVPAVLASFPDGPDAALAVIGLYLVVQLTESFVVLPLITESSISLAPALVIGGQLILGSLLGFLGVALATPMAAAALIFVQMVYVQDTLGNKVELPKACNPGSDS